MKPKNAYDQQVIRITIFFFRAPHFEMLKQTLLLQLTQPRHPHGTQKVLLSAAAFLP